MSANRWSVLQVLFSGLADFGEVFVGTEDGATEPHGVSLDHVLEHIALDTCVSSSLLIEDSHSLVNSLLQVVLKTGVEASEQGRTTRQNNVFVQVNSVTNGAALDSFVNNLLQRLSPVFVDEFLNKTS